jgi:hypothetical protein
MVDARRALLQALSSAPPASDDLTDLLQRSFRVTLLDALSRLPAGSPGAATSPAAVPRGDQRPEIAGPEGASVASPSMAATSTPSRPADGSTPSPAATAPEAARPARFAPAGEPGLAPAPRAAPAPLVPGDEAPLIQEAASRAGIDARFLLALRRTENGGPGREFGVLSVPAPTYDDQARVAAETVRRNIERFERTGRSAVDPASGRYTEDFIRFFSGRYAPIGAANDPAGLNRHHAGNLLKLYDRQA